MKTEDFSSNRKSKREYLNDSRTGDILKGLTEHFQSKVSIPRIRMGNNQEIETLINEEALLFAQYLRNEKQSWVPRVASAREQIKGGCRTGLRYYFLDPVSLFL